MVLYVSNQRSYYFISVPKSINLGFVWQKLSEKGYYKLHGFFDLSKISLKEVAEFIKDSALYYDSLADFLNNKRGLKIDK